MGLERREIEAREHCDNVHRLLRRCVQKRLAKMCDGIGSQRRHRFEQQVRILTKAGAAKSLCQCFSCRAGNPAKKRDETDWKLVSLYSVVNEFRETRFDGEART